MGIFLTILAGILAFASFAVFATAHALPQQLFAAVLGVSCVVCLGCAGIINAIEKLGGSLVTARAAEEKKSDAVTFPG